jgi:ADP-ribose pyrophosphatase
MGEDQGEGEVALPTKERRIIRTLATEYSQESNMLKSEKTLSTQQIYQGRAVRIRVDTIEKAGGKKTTREVVEHADCVAVVVLDEQGNVLLVRQFRHPVGKSLLEIPAGGIDPGEDAVDSVRRELQEEIGYFPRKIEKLGGFYSVPGYGTEYLHCFVATDLVPSRLVAEDTDEIELVRVPTEEIPRLITSGEICDAKSIAALLTFVLTRRNWQ